MFFNVLTVGAGEWNEAFSPCILEKDGISVAVLQWLKCNLVYLEIKVINMDVLGSITPLSIK